MFFGRIFSRKKETAPTTTEALDNLRETEFLLIRKQEHLENKIADVSNFYSKQMSINLLLISASPTCTAIRHQRQATGIESSSNQEST